MRGLLIEMPVLDNALLGCAIAFTPLLVGLTFGAPVARLSARWRGSSRAAARCCGDMMLDWVSQDPKPSASVLQGLFFGRVAPPARGARRRCRQPTLVIGHYRDPVHPFSDSDMLVRELPNARLVEASSILELRLTPERLTGEIVAVRGALLQAAAAPGRARRAAAGPPRRRGRRPRRRTRPASLPPRCRSRREQKEALRREREQREAEARAAAQRKRLVGIRRRAASLARRGRDRRRWSPAGRR